MKTKQLDVNALKWIKERSLQLATEINLTSYEAIKAQLGLGFELGETPEDLVKRIEQYFDGNASMRATRVARTETIAAYNEGALDKYQKAGFDKVVFTATPDACAEVCLPYDGEVFETQSGHGMIPLHVNCRCMWLGHVE